MAMKKHIYVNGVNISKPLENFGYLILQNVSKMEIPVDTIGLAVERLNNLKKKARIVEGSYTRSRMNDVGLSLLSGELVLCIAGLYHILNGWTGHGSPIIFQTFAQLCPHN